MREQIIIADIAKENRDFKKIALETIKEVRI